jgi:hypothetical protein
LGDTRPVLKPATNIQTALPTAPTGRELFAVGLGALATLLVMYAIVTERTGLLKDDPRIYTLMAEDPTLLARLPYAFRVLTPLLVYLLPFDPEVGFTLITLAGLWLTGCVLYLFLRRLPLSVGAAVGGLALFLTGGGTTRALTTPLYVDALTYLTEMLAFYAVLTRREALFGVTLLFGVLNKETLLLLAPVYLLQQRAEGRLKRGDLSRVALVLGPAVLALALAVVVKLALGGVFQQGLDALRPMPRTFYQNIPSFQDLADIYTIFGAGWLLALATLRGGQVPAILRYGLAYAALLILQLSVARGDEGRVLSHLLPVVVPLAAVQFELHHGPARWALVAGCLASVVNSRWVILPWAAVRYGLVTVGTALAAGVLLTDRFRPR